ncbi:hypothetical protein GH5_05532 [Leishmania sp. Ghana 2012 LV757]|uniref:hypothetical protein n=1 Tax=Leishmania sp. Ghana 2012 LV757 TaxID=2803181 RepID=UPI001B747275|nr:hypothetical protein GH5_05532 [Leishmania sp. Ghana 2012 LV757]
MKGATASTNALVVPEALLANNGLAEVSRTNFLEVVHLHDFVLRLPEELLLCEARRLRVKCRAENGITAWLPTLQELVGLVPEEGVACAGASEESP